jgi:hypothetical protein
LAVTLWQGSLINDSSKKQLRAYVVTDNVQVTAFEVGRKIKTDLWMNNEGQTPPLEAVWISGVFLDDSPDKPMTSEIKFYSCDDLFKLKGQPHWHLQRASHVYQESEQPLTQAEHDRVASGNAGVMFYGRICYDDVFSERHYTTFCWRWTPTAVLEKGPAVSCDTNLSAT